LRWRNPNQTQQILENFADSETPALQRLKKMIGGKFYTSGRFVITKHELSFEKEMPAEKTMEMMQKFSEVLEKVVFPWSAILLFDVDFTVDLVVGLILTC
jgi:hypothetical protein